MSRSTSKRARKRGYTMIEVLMAMGIFAAGAVAILAMHAATTRGNAEARQMTTANQLVQRWIERLRRDSVLWTAGNAAALAPTSYLDQVPPTTGVANWFVPVPPVTSGESANFDFYGNDTAVETDMRYCTNIRLEWLYEGRAIRGDVRVWWLRRAATSTAALDTGSFANCARGVDPNTLTGRDAVRMIYASTVLRYTPRPD
jgi:prepilin-type N-terminal cleavage/methylation domain-containing protein